MRATRIVSKQSSVRLREERRDSKKESTQSRLNIFVRKSHFRIVAARCIHTNTRPPRVKRSSGRPSGPGERRQRSMHS